MLGALDTMATILDPPPANRDERFVINDVDWSVYETMLQVLGDRRTPRLTYDGRNLELTSPSPSHESYKSLFGRLLEAMAYELNIPIRTGGSMTFRRPGVKRGLEPDECYWIQNEKMVRGKRDIDLEVDPPPDLFIEIEISPGALDRMAICARLGVPEVWRFNGVSLGIHVLQRKGTYDQQSTSVCFPFLPVQEMLPFLELDPEIDETSRARQFAAHVRQYFNR